MKLKYSLSTLVLGFALFSCGGASDEKETEKTAANEEVCSYSYDHGSTTFEWTAYKTSEKLPVKGGFNEIEVKTEAGENQLDVIKTLHFTINTKSINSKNEERDAKIYKHFFETISAPTIKGHVTAINEDGTATVAIDIRGIMYDIKGDYTLVENTFSFTSSTDLLHWNAISGVDALNKVCKDLHTGPDGVSKLWSEIGLSFSTTLTSDCD